MGPVAQSDGHDCPGLLDEPVPGVAAVIDDIVVAAEDAVREPVVPHELPGVLDRVQLRALRRQRDERDVGRHLELVRQVPSGLIKQQHGMCMGRHRGRDLGEMQAHGCGVAVGQDEARRLALLGADGAEEVGRRRALILRRGGPGAASGPAPGNLVLLAYPGLIGEPDLYGAGGDALLARDFRQAGGKVLLKRSTAPAACAWWRGRAESLR
jgi:hypothetical protein